MGGEENKGKKATRKMKLEKEKRASEEGNSTGTGQGTGSQCTSHTWKAHSHAASL